ncbi:MAG TPA: hypothetical protein VFH43_01985, partial [Candidatus Kapabacteria bacterium]|nr:hypothetical protein [Candidatus Kapabacteria bacterium]
TLLFHPEFGLERTQLTVISNGVRYRPSPGDLRVNWDTDGVEPIVYATWNAGPLRVRETFRCPEGESFLVRDVEIEGVTESVDVEVALYASNALFNWFSISENCLEASGYSRLRVWTSARSTQNERFLTIHVASVKGTSATSFYYELHPQHVHPNHRREDTLVREQHYWLNASQLEYSGEERTSREIARLFKISSAGLRSAVSELGRFDASIWQYNFEWSGDASMVAEALVYAGHTKMARAVLHNILTRLTNDKGMAMESSRFRGGQHAELNNNGEILKANLTYYDWTGDASLISEHYPRIKAIAEYLLQPEYTDPKNHLLRASRDIWERMESMGILPGYDVSHQTFGILGLDAASKIATIVGDEESSDRWSQAGERLRDTFLNDPTYRFIDNDRIIKRRLLDGSVQYEIRMNHEAADDDFFRKFVPPGMPLSSEGHALWEPDASEVFPICFGLVNGQSDVARHTLEVMEMLWSQHWEGGGYGRYNVLSEPDSPGPWPFATGYMAAAYLEAGNIPMAMRAIDWLSQKARHGGSWFEFYGYRPTPPLPPTGIIVWGWAQFVTVVVKHILCAKVDNGEITLSPRLPGFSGQLRFKDELVTF